ncbi:MAG: hypothetical protein COT81_02530 [Candidatus Buchananbacteria bacterium CG10_big_fil_rev_8_21_14_0_10_42_9]|uniref:Uncharacterized protein n=1 Tax=Candidatus Buchananbacteria bacterium CG10_big_fil_rev_8_21_14_0_10_42_9 TaxID=1974526 RepID=A0A2H0W3S2_9BACT|nr:MAG: hypothetical protein COT81_02530 [Candidatus Buchananbacteria bacterium CG10_big_fil_rev_8_21_14_0_10_42_9]
MQLDKQNNEIKKLQRKIRLLFILMPVLFIISFALYGYGAVQGNYNKQTGDQLTAADWNTLTTDFEISWQDVNLTDNASFDVNCEYRMSISGDTSRAYAHVVSPSGLIFETSSASFRLASIPANEKGFLDIVEDGNTANIILNNPFAVSSIQKLCPT